MAKEEEDSCLSYVSQLRETDINAEFYPDTVKQKRQYNYAQKKEIKYLVTVRSQEIASGTLFVKDLSTGDSKSMTINELNYDYSKRLIYISMEVHHINKNWVTLELIDDIIGNKKQLQLSEGSIQSLLNAGLI